MLPLDWKECTTGWCGPGQVWVHSETRNCSSSYNELFPDWDLFLISAWTSGPVCCALAMSVHFTRSSAFMVAIFHVAIVSCGEWGTWLCDKELGMMLHCPFLYTTLKSYPWSLMTYLVSLDEEFGWLKTHVNALWSIITSKCDLSKYGLHSSTAHTTLTFISDTEYDFSASLNNLNA